MGIWVMVGRCSAPPARHGNMDPPLVCTCLPWGITQPHLRHPSIISHVHPPKN